MKKIAAWMMILLLTALTVTGCGNNGLADYKKAVDKTDQIIKGQNSGEFTMTMDFNTKGMTPEEISELDYYKNMSGSFRAAFDMSKNQGVYRNYMNLGGLGFDFDLYQNGKEMFVKLPIAGKYMKIDDMLKEGGSMPEAKAEMISGDTLKALGAEWVGMLKQEDVFKGKDIVLTTPDGEVKTTVYTITLKGEQVRAFEEKAITILSEDKNIRINFETMMKKKADQSKEYSFDEFVAKIKEQIAKDTVESFQYTAYVDIDGYIVNETIEVKIVREALAKGEPESIDFKLELKNWDINKDQTLDFPELTDENTMKTDDLDNTMPSLFKDLFKAQ